MPRNFVGVSDSGLAECIESLISSGVNPDPSQFLVTPARYYHRQTYATAGQAQLTYFSNATANPIVSNWPANGLPQSRPMIWTGIAFDYDPLDLTGARVAANAQIGSAATAATMFATGEELRTIFSSGIVNVTLNNRLIIDSFYGLDQFPSGRGPQFDVATATAVGATNLSSQAAIFNNGPAIAGNEFRFSSPIVVGATIPIVANVTWNTVLTVTAAFTLRARLIGQSVQRLTN